MKKAEWGKGIEIQKTNIGLPKRIWEAGRIQALKENRTFQELVASALEDYLRKVRRSKKGGTNGK